MSFDPAEHVGEPVTIRGTALDARAGAAVQLADGMPVYVVGLESWADDVSGRFVEVSGQLRRRPSRIPPPSPSGERYHGLGETYALEAASWTVLD
jgi:hypothetical protein